MLAVGWYQPAQWALLLAHSADRDELESTHAEWLASAELSLQRLREAGQHPVKIDIDVEEMIEWCARKHVPLDGSSRSEFIAKKARPENKND